jgi:hypothetical protein
VSWDIRIGEDPGQPFDIEINAKGSQLSAETRRIGRSQGFICLFHFINV